MSYVNGRYSYTAKLMGLLPTNFQYTPENSGPWELKDIKVCKKPSQQEVKGQIDYAGHPTLVGSAISERKHGIAEYISFDADSSNSSHENNNSLSNSDEENEAGKNGDITNYNNNNSECSGSENTDSKSTRNGNDTKPQKKDSLPDTFANRSEQQQEDGEEQEEDGRYSEMIISNFIKNCFDPKVHTLPDFICERLLPIFLASNEDPFVIQARKLKFVPKDSPTGEELETIELKFLPHTIRQFSFSDGGWLGPLFSTWAVGQGSKTESSEVNPSVANLQSATRTLRLSEGENSDLTQNNKENSGEEDDYELFAHHHHAFIEGSITRGPKNNPSRTFTVAMSALVGGVWRLEDNPENYTCAHLAEMRTAQETTVNPFSASGKRNTFYKRIRMRRNWVQAMLAGEQHYLVGITASVPNASNVRVIKELWLYDVDKIPRAILLSAEDEDFVPWTAEEIYEKIINAFQLIHETVHTATFEDTFNFIQFSDYDQLVYDSDGSLLKVYMDTKKQVVIKGLPSPSFTVESLEDKAQFDNELFLTILNCVGYPISAQQPIIERVGRDLELTFDSQALAAKFINEVKNYWTKKKNIPSGFERLWIEQKPITLPKEHPLSGRVSEKIRPGPNTNRFHNNKYNTNNSNATNNNNDFYHHGSSNRLSLSSSPGTYTNRAPGRQRSISMSDSDDNWRK